MLTCVPQSLFSWDFSVHGARAGPGATTLNFWTEQGTVTLGGRAHTIRKHGPMSGRWTLERAGVVLVEARKPSPVFRAFELHSGGGHLILRAVSALGRSYELRRGHEPVGTIQPLHFLTSRTEIRCAADVPELDQLFAFWLAALTWRRAARRRNNSAN